METAPHHPREPHCWFRVGGVWAGLSFLVILGDEGPRLPSEVRGGVLGWVSSPLALLHLGAH